MTLLHSNRHFRLLLLTGVLTVLSITLSPAADPPAAKPVSETGSYPGVFMNTKPGLVIRSA